MDIDFVIFTLTNSFKEAIMITSFVLSMMLLIEYINVQSKSLFSTKLREKKFGQILLAAILGITPGCLGAFTVVSLYTHRVVGLAAIVTAMIATSGDEAFVMYSMIPIAAIKIHIFLFIIAILSGLLVDKFIKKKHYEKKNEPFPYHNKNERKEIECVCFKRNVILYQLKNLSFSRFLLILGTISFLSLLLFSIIGPNIWNWKKIIFLLISSFALFVFLTVPEHFLEEHIWEHIIKKHLFRIFVWTFGTIFIIHLLEKNLNFNVWINENLWIILIMSVIIGIIPESGPHLIFVTLFAQGHIPFAILLASSIVQDGHGMLPLLAESKKEFFIVKAINIAIGLIVGSILLIV